MSIIWDYNYHIAERIRDLTGNQTIDLFSILIAEYAAYLIPLTLVALWFLRGKNRKDSLFVFTATILSIEISYIIGELYYHPRPFEMYDTLLSRVPQNTFPSQHAATLFPFSFAFLYRNRIKLGSFFLALGLINSFTRIYVGFHFPLDIMAGIIIGLFSLAVIMQIEPYIEKLSDQTVKWEKHILNKLKQIYRS